MNEYDNNTIENGNLDLTPPPGKGLSQEGLLEIALRHRWVILLTAVLFLVAGFLYLSKATPIYTSSARLYVEQSGPKIITEYKGVMTQSNNYLYTQGELIKSTPIIANVVNDAQIRRLETFAEVDNLVAYVKKNLDVTIGKKNDIVTVSFDSPYPAEAAQIVNAVVDSYVGYHSTRKRSTVAEVLRILQKEKVKRDNELSEKFEQMLEFVRTNGVVSFDNKGGHIVFQKLAKLSEALTEAQLATINAKADYEAIQNMVSEPAKIKQFATAQSTVGVRVFVNDEETKLRSELKDLEVRLKNARLHCTENHPSIQAIRAKIDHTREQLQSQAKKFAEAYLEVMRQRWTTAKQREDELVASFDAQGEAAQNLGVKATEYSVLQSELRRTERLCEILDDRIKELNVTEDVGALNISVLEAARPAGKPSEPQKARVIAIALVLGLMLGCGFALLRDWLDYRLRSAEEISAILGIPVLGVVPTMSEEQTITARGQKVWLEFKPIVAKAYQTIRTVVFSGTPKGGVKTIDVTSPAVGGGKAMSKRQTIVDRGRKVWLEFKPIIAKSYQTIRTAVLSSTPKGRAKTIDVTSPAPADSKTTLKKRTIVDRGRKVWLEPKSAVAETYQTRLAAALFGAPRGEAKTAIVASVAPGGSKTTSKKQTVVTRGQKVRLESKSIIAEAYRTIRTAVLFGIPKGEAKTILITSPAPSDGKTTLVSNLAITMAQAGQKTLILDADFRKPTQHKIFEIDNKKGLSSVLAGRYTVDEVTQPGPVDGLDLLPCGPEVPNPSEMLNSDAFIETLSDLSERYDRVIIDSPPVTPLTDSQILGALCDITLLVLRAEKSTRKFSLQARDNLLSVGAHILGAVVNDVSRKGGRYGYYAGYGYYGYGHRKKKKEYEQEVYA